MEAFTRGLPAESRDAAAPGGSTKVPGFRGVLWSGKRLEIIGIKGFIDI
jgi:hypothetical protein